MTIEILDFWSLEKLANAPFAEKTAVISIDDIGSVPPKLKYNPLAMLRLEFDDIHISDIDYENCGRDAFRLFSSEQAKQIANFVEKYKASVDKIICQCKFGVSRSSAVAAAIKQHIDGSGLSIFTDSRYRPNIHVFQTLTEAFYKVEKTK